MKVSKPESECIMPKKMGKSELMPGFSDEHGKAPCLREGLVMWRKKSEKKMGQPEAPGDRLAHRSV